MKALNATHPYTYTAREEEKETGLYYYRARYYDPRVGRFLSKDKGGRTKKIDLLEPIRLNPYLYAYSNPIIAIDPFGEKPLIIRFFKCILLTIKAYNRFKKCKNEQKCKHPKTPGKTIGVVCALVLAKEGIIQEWSKTCPSDIRKFITTLIFEGFKAAIKDVLPF